MVYYPGGTSVLGSTFFAGDDVWKFVSPDPTGAGQRGTQVALRCVANAPQVSIATLVSSDFGHPGVWSWIPGVDAHSPTFAAACCPRLQTFAVAGGSATICAYSNGPNLSLVSSNANPFQLDYDGVDGNSNPHATKFYTDLTIDGPDSTVYNGTTHQCCDPCAIPKVDMTLTIGANTYTLAYDIIDQDWSDGTYTMQCISGFVHLTGPGTWDLSIPDSSCGPIHFKFTGTSDAYVDEP
jgi:hypothetical protein